MLKRLSLLSCLLASSCASLREFPPIGNCIWFETTSQWQCVDHSGNLLPTPPLKQLIAFPEDDWAKYDKVCHQ